MAILWITNNKNRRGKGRKWCLTVAFLGKFMKFIKKPPLFLKTCLKHVNRLERTSFSFDPI